MTEHAESISPGRKMPSAASIVFLTVGIFVVFAGLYWSRSRLETVLENRIDSLIADYSPLISIEYESVGVGIFGRSIHIDGIRVPIGAAAPIRVGRLVVHQFDHRHRIPQSVVLSAESVEIPGADAYLNRFLPLIKIPDAGKMSADFFLDCAYDPDARRFSIRRFTVRAPDRGTLSAAAGIGNISLENAAFYLIMPHVLLFDGLSLVYSDDGLISRWMADAAARAGVGPDEYARSLKRDIGSRVVLARQNGEAALAEALEAIIEFLNRPRTLSISARPERPVPFGRLMRVSTFEELVEVLDLRIMANQYR